MWENLKIGIAYSGKFRKQRSYQHESVMEAVRMSIENLSGDLKRRYEQLAVFLDDVGIPTKVRKRSLTLNYFRLISQHIIDHLIPLQNNINTALAVYRLLRMHFTHYRLCQELHYQLILKCDLIVV
jgi:stress response protein SCP2